MASHAHVIERVCMSPHFMTFFMSACSMGTRPLRHEESAMSLTRFALLAAAGAILTSAPVLACDYSMKSDVTAEAPAVSSPATVAQATDATASASVAASTSIAPVATETAPAQTAKAETGAANPSVTN